MAIDTTAFGDKALSPNSICEMMRQSAASNERIAARHPGDPRFMAVAHKLRDWAVYVEIVERRLIELERGARPCGDADLTGE